MNKPVNPFALDLSDPAFAHLADPTIAPKSAPKPKQRASKWVRRYTLFPYAWQERLRSSNSISTYRVALHLLYEYWRSDGRRIRLANAAAAAEGVGRTAKLESLRELERLGLIEVEWRLRKSPLITCLLVGDLPAGR